MTAPRRALPAAPAGSEPAADRSLTVDVFLSELSGGGAQRRTVTLVNGMARRGVRTRLLLARAQGPLLRLLDEGVEVVELRRRRSAGGRLRLRRSWRVLASVPALARHLRADPPDLLLSAANHVHRATALAHWWSGTDVPLVIRLSNHLSRAAWNDRRRPRPLRLAANILAFRRATALVAVCRAVAEDVQRVVRIADGRMFVVYNPVVGEELRRLARQDPGHPWFRPGEPPVVLGAGRLVPQKDFPTLLRAFARLRRSTHARLVILGGGKPRARARLEELARRLGISADTDFAGFVENPYAFMARAAVLVLSSAWEGLPGVLIEAMACGCPVVSTDCPGGSWEILEGGRYGPLVPVGDDAAMAEAIRAVLARPLPAALLRSRAELFSVDRQVGAWLDVLRRVAAGKQDAKPLRRGLSPRPDKGGGDERSAIAHPRSTGEKEETPAV